MTRVARFFIAAMLAVITVSCSESKNQHISSSIKGLVTGKDGPEAGVWVIAETNDLASPFTKIVVTNEEGRFVLPDMPEASYRIWVRGYGLKDSGTEEAVPGEVLTLEASYPSSPQEAAAIYPASYWYSLTEPPLAN